MTGRRSCRAGEGGRNARAPDTLYLRRAQILGPHAARRAQSRCERGSLISASMPKALALKRKRAEAPADASGASASEAEQEDVAADLSCPICCNL